MSKEVEPIFIVRLPKVYSEEDLNRIGIVLTKRLVGYKVLIVESNVEDVSFECYNLQEAEKVNLDELKDMIKSV